MLIAAAVTVGTLGAMPVFAEFQAADYAKCVDESQKELVEASIDGYFTSWQYENDGILTQKEDYVYSDFYAVYGFQTMEQVDGAIVLVGQDTEWIGYFSALLDTDENGTVYPATYHSGVNAVVADAVDNDKAFLFGTNHDAEASYWVNGKFRSQMIYVDGMTYDWGWNEKVGGDPSTLEYAPYQGGLGTDTTDTAETTETTTQTERSADFVGDVNLDGRVDITDAVMLNQGANGAVMLDDAQIANADCDGNGEVNAADSLTLIQFLVHVIDTMPL